MGGFSPVSEKNQLGTGKRPSHQWLFIPPIEGSPDGNRPLVKKDCRVNLLSFLFLFWPGRVFVPRTIHTFIVLNVIDI
jgi:hypothetical protein